MELRHLRYFVMVSEELNFTRAAKRLGIAQSALSRQIHDLEQELGVRLFDRNSSRVFLTDPGCRFLNEAQVVLQRAAQAVEAARQVQSGVAGTIRLGIAKGLGDIVSRIINNYLRLFPSVEIDVKDIPSGFQSEAFPSRKIDVGFMRPPVDDLQLDSQPLFWERFSVVLRKTNPLARRKSVRLKDLVQETVLLIDRHISPGAYDKVFEMYREAGLTPKIIPTETMPYDEAGAILVESGKGIYLALGKNPYHPSFADRLAAVPLREPSAVMPVHIVWRKDEQTKAILEFVKFTRGKFEETGELRRLTRDLNGILRLGSEPTKRVRPRSRRARHA